MNGFQALLTFLGIIATTNAHPPEKHAHGSENLYHGRYTRDIHDPEFLIPKRVFEDGSFNTYSLPNFYDRQELSERRKRSLDASEQEPETDKLHLVLPFNGIDHHVELTPYHDFISPHMVIETRGAGLKSDLNSALRFKRASDQQCHYRGFVRGHHKSRATLSLCDGVVGYLRTNHGQYFIEPAIEAEPQQDGQHVHVAYKRNALTHEHKGKHCATSDNWEAAWAEQLALRAKQLMAENPNEAKRAAPSSATHSIHRYIEIGLVADRRFLDFYNNTNYEQYLLTIMNMVADFYHDKSVGNQIDVVVVRMIYLEKEKEEIDLLISPAAEETLDSFAKWAHKMNPTDHTHPNHFDIAVLVTRHDICSDGTNCNLMGLAFVGTACNPEKAASINEDSGLLLGIVIAHEVGHVMGCSHDDINISGCPPADNDTSQFVMSPYVDIFTIRWSPCSRKYITTLLDSGLGECLNDDPRNPPEKFKYPNMLPGAMYDADFQCEMMYPGSKLCPHSADSCNELWCTNVNGTGCLSKGSSLADGTKCGENKWCIHKKCVDMGGRPTAVHGRWGQWGPMGACSRTCGGGIKLGERECNNPPPSNGGRYCTGERKKLVICNTSPCDVKKPSFRAVQCSSYNGKNVFSDGVRHTWTVFLQPDMNPCELNCINEQNVWAQLSPTANDTTPCKPGTNNMCIAGTCRKVGCDWVLDSDAVEDKCGICKGDGTKCKQISEVSKAVTGEVGYTKIVTIPRGARNIYATKLKPHKNWLALRLENSNVYCLNANYSDERSGDYECASATVIYQHPEALGQEIIIKGPIREDIRLEYIRFDPSTNPGVRYQYSIMSSDPSYTPKYMWDFLEWSACNAKCGGGTMISEPECVEEQGGKVSASFCEKKSKPEPKTRVCNKDPCRARWRVSQWSRCSACDGKKGLKHRKVQCIRTAARAGEDDVQANLDACKGRVPKQKEECIGQRPCKKTCPKKTRNVNRALEGRAKKKQSLPVEEQAKMIDKFVDLSLARYLEKAYGVPREGEETGRATDSGDFRQLLREWSIADEEKRKRGTCDRKNNFTTPKPGSIIKDSVPIENVVLMEAPFVEEGLKANLSDRAYQEAGDVVGVGLDTSNVKVYRGEEAVKKIGILEGHHNTMPPPKKENNTGE